MHRVKWLLNLGQIWEFLILWISQRGRREKCTICIVCIRIPWERGLPDPHPRPSQSELSGISIWIRSFGDNFHQNRHNSRSDSEGVAFETQVIPSFLQGTEFSSRRDWDNNRILSAVGGNVCGAQRDDTVSFSWETLLSGGGRDLPGREIIWNEAMQQDHLPCW